MVKLYSQGYFVKHYFLFDSCLLTLDGLIKEALIKNT